MLKVTNLKIEYSDLIFKDVNFILGNHEKVGLVGLNGSGKSTLLKIIAGLEEADAGSISVANEKLGYLPQKLNLNDEQFVGEYLESLVQNIHTDMWQVDIALSELGMKLVKDESGTKPGALQTIDFYSKIKLLSEGQKLKLCLCKLVLEQSTILLLDEPTNHLDIEGIKWLENFLQNFPRIVIVISHDRLLLNNLVEIIFEIDEQTLHIFHGNYDDYIEQKKSWIEKRKQEFVLQEKKRDKLESRLELVRKFSSGKKQSAAIQAIKNRIKREIDANEITNYKAENLKGINIEGSTHKKKVIIAIEDLSFSYAGKKLINHANFQLYGQDKVWFYGANGIGKSTLIKLITNELLPDNGIVKIGENVRWKYFSQDQSHLPDELSVREYITKFGKVDYSQSFGMLEKFLFPKHLQNKKLAELSPGQRARLSFAVFSLEEHELLILDEPTNHLDIRTKEIIEKALYEYKGSILLISHDRYFVEQVGIGRMITLEKGVIKEG